MVKKSNIGKELRCYGGLQYLGKPIDPHESLQDIIIKGLTYWY